MGIRVRVYIFEEGGALKRIPRRIGDALVFGEDAIPAYADTRQKVAEVVVEYEDGQPIRILNATGSFWSFDAEGRVDRSLLGTAWAAWEFAHKRESSLEDRVIDLRPNFKRKAWERENRWALSTDDLHRIASDLWPGAGTASEVEIVKGKAQKRPPLTSDARDALTELEGKVSLIRFAIEQLSEPALKGLAFEARRLARTERENPDPIWLGIAEEADQEREIKARRRTGRGRWYAVLTVWRQDCEHRSESIDEIEVLCSTRALAVEAAKRLLAENAHRFDVNIRIEVEVRSELEHLSLGDEQPDDGDGGEQALG